MSLKEILILSTILLCRHETKAQSGVLSSFFTFANVINPTFDDNASEVFVNIEGASYRKTPIGHLGDWKIVKVAVEKGRYYFLTDSGTTYLMRSGNINQALLNKRLEDIKDDGNITPFGATQPGDFFVTRTVKVTTQYPHVSYKFLDVKGMIGLLLGVDGPESIAGSLYSFDLFEATRQSTPNTIKATLITGLNAGINDFAIDRTVGRVYAVQNNNILFVLDKVDGGWGKRSGRKIEVCRDVVCEKNAMKNNQLIFETCQNKIEDTKAKIKSCKQELFSMARA